MIDVILKIVKPSHLKKLQIMQNTRMITPLYFCSSNLIYFGQKERIEKKFSDF